MPEGSDSPEGVAPVSADVSRPCHACGRDLDPPEHGLLVGLLLVLSVVCALLALGGRALYYSVANGKTDRADEHADQMAYLAENRSLQCKSLIWNGADVDPDGPCFGDDVRHFYNPEDEIAEAIDAGARDS